MNIELEHYLQDGANWQAQAVMAYLKGNVREIQDGTYNKVYGFYDASIYIGRYENCREQGYIVSVRYKMSKQVNYAFYEHRNRDKLCVVRFESSSMDTPRAEMVWEAMNDDKYGYTASFPCGEIKQCGDYIIEDAQKFINSVLY